MPQVEEFCATNVTKFLLGVFIVVAIFVCVGIWVFYSPGRNEPIIKPAVTTPSN